MFHFDTKTLIDLCFVFKQLAIFGNMKETCDEILTEAQISHKPRQATSSWQSNEAQACTS